MARRGVRRGPGLERVRATLANPSDVLAVFGAYLVGQVQRAFTAQRRGAAAWPPRAVPNLAGIVADLNAGRGVPARRFEPRPAGVDTGLLRRSITYTVRGKQVFVGTTVPYARKVHEGGASVVRLAQGARRALGNLLKRRPEVRGRLAALFHRPVTVNVPPRPFLTLEAADRAKLRQLVRDELRRRKGRR